jgi:hypothetical protein
MSTIAEVADRFPQAIRALRTVRTILGCALNPIGRIESDLRETERERKLAAAVGNPTEHLDTRARAYKDFLRGKN